MYMVCISWKPRNTHGLKHGVVSTSLTVLCSTSCNANMDIVVSPYNISLCTVFHAEGGVPWDFQPLAQVPPKFHWLGHIIYTLCITFLPQYFLFYYTLSYILISHMRILYKTQHKTQHILYVLHVSSSTLHIIYTWWQLLPDLAIHLLTHNFKIPLKKPGVCMVLLRVIWPEWWFLKF